MSNPLLDPYREWIELVTPLKVIYADDVSPTAPRPNVALDTEVYAALKILSDESDMSTANERTTDTPGTVDPTKFDQHRGKTREGLLGVEIYGPGAADYARALELSAGRADVLALLQAAGDFVIVRQGPALTEPLLLGATREPGARITFVIGWVDSEVYEIDGVDTIETTVTVEE